MIVVHASFPIDSERIDEAVDLATHLVEESNEEPGTIEYRAARELGSENTLRFFECYEDEAAFESHTETEHFRRFEAELPDLLAGEPTVRRFDVAEAADVEL